jgi:hypothetical protein
LNTNNPSSTLSAIWEYALANNMMLNTVNTLGPSLEDVFVNLTGITPEISPKKINEKG